MFLYRLLKNNSALIFFIALMIVVASMPLSRFGLSFGQFSLLGIWIIEGRYKEKVRALFTNRAALVLISFYFLHVIGLLYSQDFNWAIKDLRVKLPLLFLPVVFATSRPLSKERTNILLLLYIASVLVASLISLWIYLFGDVTDFRQLSPFISHIRLSLNVCLALFFMANFAFVIYRHKPLIVVSFTIILTWLFLFLLMIESVTGIVIVGVVFYSLVISGVFKFRKTILKASAITTLIVVPLILGMYFSNTVNGYLRPVNNDLDNLEQYTAMGNTYRHDTIHQPVESGRYVGLYVCEPELKSSWNKLSVYAYEGHDERGQELKYTLIRYLNSKGLRKDSNGIAQLNKHDIRNIEKGIANVHYTKPFSLNSRLYKLLWEYQINRLHGNPGGHTVSQRLEFWRVSMAIIKDHFFIGVGTGDIKQAYADKYESLNTQLEMRFRHRAHNQFLAIFVTFGLFGLVWFLFSLVYPGLEMKKLYRYRYFVFWVTLMLSMFVEDTLETQMGATLFAFFNAFLLFGVKEEDGQQGGG
jgi:hypothetical protein